MTQEDVKDYLLLPENDCYVYDTRVKEDGIYYYMRKRGTKKIVVVYPLKKGVYTRAAVCHICDQLVVKTPEYGQSMKEILSIAKAQAEAARNEEMENDQEP